ncbi:hypothetical protein QM565_29065 [Geitlerinema splendidum]|nr:hypothetical protein [Geitlerinema splendidum]
MLCGVLSWSDPAIARQHGMSEGEPQRLPTAQIGRATPIGCSIKAI